VEIRTAKIFWKNLLCKVDSLFCQVIFPRQISLFQNTKEKIGGKKIYFANE
jgi:hypothetical protein